MATTGRLLTYLRVSSLDQASSGLGRTAQEYATLNEAALLGIPWADEWYGPVSKPGFFCDDGVTAFRIAFKRRPAGAALLKAIQPGDTLLVHRLCRLCRSMEDFCWLIKFLKQKKAKLRSIEPPINMDTPDGRAIAKLMVLIAEWESDIKGERIRGALAIKKLAKITSKLKAANKLISLESAYEPVRKTLGSTEPNVAGRIWIYVRVSHPSSTKSGLSILDQLVKAGTYAATLSHRLGLPVMEPVQDLSQSAFRKDLRYRQHGKKMFDSLKAGDHVVMIKPDRVFCQLNDMLNTVADWDDMGVTAHFSESGTTTSGNFGKLLLTISTMFAQFERELIAARNRDMQQVLMAAGRYRGGKTIQPFWRLYRGNGVKKLVLDRQELVEFRYLRLLRANGFSIKKACERLELLTAKREKRKPIPLCGAIATARGFRTQTNAHRIGDTIYPDWTPHRWNSARTLYEKALAQWRELKAESKLAIRATTGEERENH